MIEAVRPNRLDKYESLAKDFNYLFEENLVSQQPQHLVEGKSFLTLEKILGTEKLNDILLACR
jgi:hypothetical protein